MERLTAAVMSGESKALKALYASPTPSLKLMRRHGDQRGALHRTNTGPIDLLPAGGDALGRVG